jgi:hypothetical protein
MARASAVRPTSRGGPIDNSETGAAWAYTRSGNVWAQQGSKLVGSGAIGAAQDPRNPTPRPARVASEKAQATSFDCAILACMSKKLPLTDFRAVRSMLEPHEFAITANHYGRRF